MLQAIVGTLSVQWKWYNTTVYSNFVKVVEYSMNSSHYCEIPRYQFARAEKLGNSEENAYAS